MMVLFGLLALQAGRAAQAQGCSPGAPFAQISHTQNATTGYPGWGSGNLSIPKFDPSVGALVAIAIDYGGSSGGYVTIANLSPHCSGTVQFVARAYHSVEASSWSSPPISLPIAELGGTLATTPPIVLSYYTGGGCQADDSCPGNGHHAYCLHYSSTTSDRATVTEPAELDAWVLGTGNASVWFNWSAMVQPEGSFPGIAYSYDVYAYLATSITVTYTYCPPALGAQFCFGDGSGALCPCGNAGQSRAGCANSTGYGASLLGFGSASSTTDELVLVASGLIPGNPAVAFAGPQAAGGGAGLPLWDGLLCVGSSLVRLGIEVPDPAGRASWGPGLAPTGGWQAGDLRRFQVWYRDSALLCTGSNLSNGLAVQF